MCTTIVVGRKASADSSLMIARSADSSCMNAQHFLVHEARDNPPCSAYSCAAHGGINNFTWPLPAHSLRFTTVAHWKTHLHGAVGFNELGVGLTGTESIFPREDALALDPWNKTSGVSEDDIPDVILPQARSAKEACALLGEIIEKAGAAEGFGVGFIDSKEIWYLETGTAHQWLAQRCPSAKYFGSGNQGRLRKFEPGNPKIMASRTLVEFAVENGFHDPAKGPFDFAASYTRNDERDRTYNDPRVWSIQKRFNPSLKQKPDDGRNFPVFLEPERKISAADLKAAMRDHYEGSEHDPYSNGLNGSEPWRPTTVFRTYESHVIQVRPELPKEIGCVIHVAFGMADLSCYLPFYLGLKSVPLHFAMGTGHADSVSLYWKFRKLQTLAMCDYPRLAPIVKAAFADFEYEIAARMAVFEKKYVEIAALDQKGAEGFLQDFSMRVFVEAEALAGRLMDHLFTIRAGDIQKEIFFANRKLKD